MVQGSLLRGWRLLGQPSFCNPGHTPCHRSAFWSQVPLARAGAGGHEPSGLREGAPSNFSLAFKAPAKGAPCLPQGRLKGKTRRHCIYPRKRDWPLTLRRIRQLSTPKGVVEKRQSPLTTTPSPLAREQVARGVSGGLRIQPRAKDLEACTSTLRADLSLFHRERTNLVPVFLQRCHF